MSVAAQRQNAAVLPRPAFSLWQTAARTALPLLLTVSSVVLWLTSLPRIDLEQMSGLGLISVLPIQTFVALAVFVAGFVSTLYQVNPSWRIALFQLVMWIFMLHGITSVLPEEPVFSVGWRHAGITEYIIRTRALDPTRDAYFSWPGFFGLSAVVTRVAGLQSPVNLIRWAPLFFNLLYLAPLVMILKAATDDQRTMWLGLWVFYTANWIGQDYFSPQAAAFFAYLLIVGILLKWFIRRQSLSAGISPAADGGDPERPKLEGSPSQRVMAASVLILVFAATVSSHQLTPFALVAGAAALVVTRQLALRGLPVLMGVILVAWLSYMTVAFLSGHLDLAFGPAGVGGAAAANVGGRLQGSRDHMIVVYGRMATTVLIWGLAVAGAIRIRKQVNRRAALWTLALAPFPLLVLQSYGGEMLLRIYLLVLPFAALFVAGLFSVRSPGVRPRILAGTAAAVFGLILSAAFLLSRYGNLTIDRFSSQEVEAVAHLYRMAPRGSLLLAPQANLPWKYRGYEAYDYKVFADYKLPPVEDERFEERLARIMRAKQGRDAFLIITRGQKEIVDLFGIPAPSERAAGRQSADPGWLARAERLLKDSGRFEVVFSNEDATIFVVAGDS